MINHEHLRSDLGNHCSLCGEPMPEADTDEIDVAIAALIFVGLSIHQIEKVPNWLLANIERNKPQFKTSIRTSKPTPEVKEIVENLRREFGRDEILELWIVNLVTSLTAKHEAEKEKAVETARHLVRKYGTRMRDGEFKAVMNGLQALTPTKTDKRTDLTKEYNMPSITHNGEEWIRVVDHVALVQKEVEAERERVDRELIKKAVIGTIYNYIGFPINHYNKVLKIPISRGFTYTEKDK